jgi:hypothetical protein
MRPEITIADLLRAFAALAPKNDTEKRAIAATLGFEWRGAVEAAAPTETAPPQPSSRPREAGRPRPPPPPTPAPDGSPKRGSTSDISISSPRTVEQPELDWLGTVRPLERGEVGRAHDPVPLFRPLWTRAILSTSLAARMPVGPPDITRAVEAIARGEALRMLPRQPILTLSGGVQALLDVGEAMQPFWHDHVVLRRGLESIVGDSLDIVECDGTPAEARRDEDTFEWVDYETHFAPRLGATVLIVSDFGLGRTGLARRTSPVTWARLAMRLARAGHRVVGFIPYPSARWPTVLSVALHLVQWDRTTTAGRISFARARRDT